MEKANNRKYNFFLGADVSRNKLDFVLIRENKLLFHREVANDVDTIFAFLKELKDQDKFTYSKCLVCMEATGCYCNHLTECLKKRKIAYIEENALKIKRTIGLKRSKTDKVDALKIAQYAQRNLDDLYFKENRRPVIAELANLCSLRDRLRLIQGSIKQPLNEQKNFIKKSISQKNESYFRATIDAINNDLKTIEEQLDETVKSDDKLNNLMKIIQSVPQIGRVTAIHILIATNEFRNIDTAKKFACYAGVAPFPYESGTIKRKAKVSHFANKKMKSLIHICALGAIRNVEELREYYRRKTVEEGKPKMLVVNAVRYKLILRIFTCVKQSREYISNYQNSPSCVLA